MSLLFAVNEDFPAREAANLINQFKLQKEGVIHLVSVVDAQTIAGAEQFVADLLNSIEDGYLEMHDLVKGHINEFLHCFSFKSHIVYGNPAREISKLASELNADFVFCATSEKGKFEKFLGSTARQIAHLAEKPTFLVKRQELSPHLINDSLDRKCFEQHFKILSCFDGSEPSIRALRLLETYAPCASNLAVLSIMTHRYSYYEPAEFNQFMRSYKVEVDRQLTNETASLAKKYLAFTAESVISTLSAGKAVFEYSNSYQSDLIVIGKSGKDPISRLFMGSTAQFVANHAGCHLLIVP